MSFIPADSGPSVILDTKQADYHAIGSDIKPGDPRLTMSRSQLERFAECPSKWLKSPSIETTNAMEFGSLVDCLVTTPPAFSELYAIYPEEYPDGKGGMKPWSLNANYCKEWRDDQEKDGKTCIKLATFNEAVLAHDRLINDEEIGGIIQSSDMQVQIRAIWCDDATGIKVQVKAMIDFLPGSGTAFGDTIYDLKVVADANPMKWDRYVFNQGLHYQGAMYRDMVNAATGLKYRNFANVAVESSAPYEPTVQQLSEEFLAMGRIAYQSDMRNYCQCLARQKWPSYPRGIVEPSAWMLKA